MVTGAFSSLMTAQPNGLYRFSDEGKQRIDAIHQLLSAAGYEILSAHIADRYGESPWGDDFVSRDLDWAATCDVQLVLLPAQPTGEAVRSDGTMIELGFAFANGKPIVLLADDVNHQSNSFFLRAFAQNEIVRCIEWDHVYQDALLSNLAEVARPIAGDGSRPREQRSDVDGVIADLRREQVPHNVVVGGMPLTVLPGVLSPRLSHAPDALIAKWAIPPGGHVLDLGCGSGVLGLAALRGGAGCLVSLDINPQAVKTTSLNLVDLGLDDRGEARLSDAYSALKSGEVFDIILFAAPYWDRAAADDLERSCFDDDYRFFQKAIEGAHAWLKPNGVMYVIFSDQGDVGRALRIIDASKMRVQEMHLFRPSTSGGHIRIIWELGPR